MSCKASNPTELKNLIENKKAIFNIKQEQTANETVEFLKYTTDNFEKKDGRYEIKNQGTKLGTTITTRVGEWYSRKNPFPPEPWIRKLWDQQADMGNIIHESIELNIKDLINQTSNLSANEALQFLAKHKYDNQYAEGLKKISDKYGYTITPSVYTNLHAGVIKILEQIYRRQLRIDKDSGKTGRVTILSEQIIVDPTEDVGGTGDLIAIFSNNDALVFDFKTKVPSFNKLNSDGTIRAESIREVFNNGAKERYKLQVQAIAKILKRRYGVRNIILGRIEPITISPGKWDKDKKLYDKSINSIRFGGSQDPALKQIPLLNEKTGFEDLDLFLSNIEKQIGRLRKKASENKNLRDELTKKIEDLEEAKVQILVYHNFNAMLKYAADLEKSLTDEVIEKMSVDDLRKTIDEFNLLSTLANSTYEYRQYVKRNNVKTPDQLAIFEGTVGSTIAVLNDKIRQLESVLYDEKVVSLIENSTGMKITNDEGKVLPFIDEGFFAKYFNQLSQFDNPLFKTLRNKLNDIQFDIKEKVNRVIQNVQEKEDAIYNHMKKTGKDKNWLISVLIDPTTDNFYSNLSESFLEELRKLKQTRDIDKIIQYYEPNAFYKEWYNKKLKDLNEDQRESFMKRNDLTLKDGKPVHPEAWLNYFGNKRLKLKDNVKTKNLSEKYLYIQSIPELANYYNMFIEYNKEFRTILDMDYFSLPDNFLANIRKDAIERVTTDGIVNGSLSAMNNFIEQFSVREDDMYFGEIEDGHMTRRVPRFFVNPFKDKNGNVAIGEKSYEFGKSLILFSKMAYNYKYMTEQESEILALRDFLVERGQEFITRSGKKMEDFVGNRLAVNLKDTNMKDIFDSFVDMYLYSVNIQPTLGDKSGTWEKRIMLAKQYFTVKALGLNGIAAAGSFMAAKTNAWIEGNKGIVYTKSQYQKALRYSVAERDKFLALYAYFDPMSIRYDNFSVSKTSTYGNPTERGFIQKYVNTRMLLRPFSYGDEYIDEIILSSMAQNFYVDELGNLKRMKTEEERINYKNRSIWNLFQYNGKDAKLNLNENQLKNVIIAFRNAAQSAQNKIKGTIPEEDKAYWQSQIIGQVVMHFKSWMPGLIRERLGNVRYNDAIQAVEMGKYVAVGYEFKNIDQLGARQFVSGVVIPKLFDFTKHLLLLGKFGKLNDVNRKREAFERWIDENPHFKNLITFEDFLDIQQKQLKSLMVELRIILTMAALIILLGSDWDDDGEKEYKELWLTRKMAAMLFKTNQEMTFMYNPVEFSKMIANPLPMLRLVTDLKRTLSNTFDEGYDIAFGNDMFFEKSKDDKTPLFYYTHQWIPGAGGITKLLDLFNKDSGENYKQ